MTGQDQSAGCVLFADVSGSTKLYESAGDAVAHAAIDGCVRLFASITQRHGGRVIKTIGDEVMSVFPDASSAGRAATDIQTELAAVAPVGTVRLGVRVGLHYGPLVESQGDVFGDTVNLSARLTEMASRNQIITSLETVEQFAPDLKIGCRRLYSIPVKGKEKEVDICEIVWSESDDATQLVASRSTKVQGPSKIKLTYRERTVELPGTKRSLVIGRDVAADLVIADKLASRAHCEVEQRGTKFVITDRSANGTWVTIDGDSPIVLRREETMLRGHGFITLGAPKEAATEQVEFTCE
jgi:adenylate cyclase